MQVGSYTLQQVLKVISNSVKHIPGSRLEPLREQMFKPVQDFSVKAELISSLIDAITLLTQLLEGDDEKG